MDDEFKLCWKNFQDNIASGFQNLYDRGDLVDVTLACDGKLLHAHKIVLAICSPYFQEIFITNPCKHPIIILKDVHFNIMCELLEFMYQGVVNVKHTELQSFMKIGQLLQIKGLATNSTSAASGLDERVSSEIKTSAEFVSNADADAINSTNILKDEKSYDSGNKSITNSQNTSVKESITSPASSPSPKNSISQESHNFQTGANLKRLSEINNDAASNYSKKPYRRSASHIDPNSDQNDGHNSDGVDNVNPEDFFLSIPHISMVESRYDLNSVKREGDSNANSSIPNSMRSSFGPSLGFEYNLYKNNGGITNSSEFSNELHVPNDYSKNFGNHMDIPPIAPGEHWFQGKLEFMLSQRGKPLLVHDGHTFGIQYVRKDKKYWQCNLSRKFNCKARVTTTDTGEIIVTNNEHCHTEIRQHLRKDYQRNKVMMNALINLSSKRFAENLRRESENSIHNLSVLVNNPPPIGSAPPPIGTPPINLKSSRLDDHERSSIDFGGNESAPDIINAMVQPEDNELPLDCGIRSVTNDNKHEHIDANNAWKCKNEAVN